MSQLGAIIAERIRLAREKTGITQSELAAELDVTRANVSGIELGRTQITVRQLEKLPNIFEMPLIWFLGLEGALELTEDELDLLFVYRELNQYAQRSVQEIARSLDRAHRESVNSQ